jgi:hypothetical protein
MTFTSMKNRRFHPAVVEGRAGIPLADSQPKRKCLPHPEFVRHRVAAGCLALCGSLLPAAEPSPSISAANLLARTRILASDEFEVVDNGIILIVPGAMEAGLTSPLFWSSLAVALVLAGAVAYPANRWLIQRGKGHAVVHSYH